MPVLEIPLDDSKAQEFFAAFGEFQKQLVKNPELWNKVSQAQRKVFATGASSPLSNVEKSWRSIAGFSGSILSNTVKITGQLLKWGTLLGGGLLGGSLWGLTRMASDAASYRRSAMGLGISIGGMRSFDINMQRFVDPGAFLSSINQAVSNPALQGPLYAMGVNPNGSTEQVSLAMLKAMRRLALNTPRGMLGTMSDAYGLGAFGGLETLMRLRSTPAEEFYRQLRAEGSDRSGLGLPPGVARKWQDFTTQMERARAEIFKTFVVGLAPLAGPLTKLSQSFAGFVSKLLSGPLAKDAINRLAHFFDTFNGTLASPKFLTSVEQLATDIESLARVIHKWFGHPTNPGAQVHVGGISDWARRQTEFMQTGIDPTAYNGGYGDKTKLLAFLGSLDKKYSLPAGTMAAIAKTESSFNANAFNAKSGAAGMFQMTPSTQKMWGVSNPYDLVQEGIAAAKYMAYLRAQFGNMDAAHAAYGGFSGVQFGETRDNMPRRMKKYVVAASAPDSGVIVRVQHKVGANPVLAAQGLSGVPQ